MMKLLTKGEIEKKSHIFSYMHAQQQQKLQGQ